MTIQTGDCRPLPFRRVSYLSLHKAYACLACPKAALPGHGQLSLGPVKWHNYYAITVTANDIARTYLTPEQPTEA